MIHFRVQRLINRTTCDCPSSPPSRPTVSLSAGLDSSARQGRFFLGRGRPQAPCFAKYSTFFQKYQSRLEYLTHDSHNLLIVERYRWVLRHNLIQRNLSITLALDGSAKVRANNKFQGISQNKAAQLAEQPEAVQKKELYDWLSISDFTIDSLTYERKKGRMPQVNQKWVLTIPKLASVSGKRLFVPIRLLSNQWSIPAADSTRQSDVQVATRGYASQEEVTLQMPEGYRLEGSVEPVVADSPFGHYELRVREESGKLLISRKLVINDSIQPKDQFGVWIEFLKTIAKNDKRKLVLVKPT